MTATDLKKHRVSGGGVANIPLQKKTKIKAASKEAVVSEVV